MVRFRDRANGQCYYWDMRFTKYGICGPPLGYSVLTGRFVNVLF